MPKDYVVIMTFLLVTITNQIKSLEEKVAGLEDQAKSDEAMIGRLMADILEKQMNMQVLHSDLQHSMQLVRDMQLAINQGQDERAALRFRITQMEVNRQDMFVTRNGQCCHVNPQCQFLKNAGNTKVYRACSGCTGSS